MLYTSKYSIYPRRGAPGLELLRTSFKVQTGFPIFRSPRCQLVPVRVVALPQARPTAALTETISPRNGHDEALHAAAGRSFCLRPCVSVLWSGRVSGPHND